MLMPPSGVHSCMASVLMKKSLFFFMFLIENCCFFFVELCLARTLRIYTLHALY
jgi:hypothetical protein